MKLLFALFASLLMGLVGCGHGPDGPHGTITAVDANSVTVKDHAGVSSTFTFTANTVFMVNRAKATATDLKVGMFARVKGTTQNNQLQIADEVCAWAPQPNPNPNPPPANKQLPK